MIRDTQAAAAHVAPPRAAQPAAPESHIVAHARRHTRARKRARTHAHTRTHARTHERTNTRARTRAHTALCESASRLLRAPRPQHNSRPLGPRLRGPLLPGPQPQPRARARRQAATREAVNVAEYPAFYPMVLKLVVCVAPLSRRRRRCPLNPAAAGS